MASSIPAGYARASFSITVPNSSGAASVRRAQTVGAGTQSITFTLLEAGGTTVSGAPQTFPLTAGSAGCTSGTNGLTCTLGVDAPLGLDVFLAQTFSTTNGTGSITGSGAVQLDVQSNSTNSASLSLTSQAQSVYLTSSSSYLGAAGGYISGNTSAFARAPAAVRRPSQLTTGGGEVTSMRVFVIALDSAGNTILNPSIYSSPISLQLIFIDDFGNPLSPGVPDVTLSVAYSSSVDPTGCGGSSSTGTSYGAVQVCSPADVVTATYDAVPNGSPGAVIIGSVGPSGYLPVPAPSTTPSPFPTGTPPGVGFILFPVTATAAPTTTPPGTGSVTVVGQ